MAGGEPDVGSAEFYSPSSGLWEPLPDLPVSLKYASGAGDGADLWVAGGQDDDGGYSGVLYALRTSSGGNWEEAGALRGEAGEEGGVVWAAAALTDAC